MNWKKFWKIIGYISLVLILNAAIITFIILQVIDFEGTNMPYYQVLSNNYIVDMLHDQGKIQWYEYHWYNKFLLWLFMILGPILTIAFFVWQNKKSTFIKAFSPFKKDENIQHVENSIELKKLLAKSEKCELSTSELKRLKKLMEENENERKG